MNSNAVKNQIKMAEKLHNKILELNKSDFINGNLESHLDEFQSLLRNFHHDDRDSFYMTTLNAYNKIYSLNDYLKNNKSPSHFKNSQSRLRVMVKRYVSGMKIGLAELYLE